jgi:transketolase
MTETKFIIGMRDAFFDALYQIFRDDQDCIIVTADNGAPSLDKFAELPGQFYQVGIAEQQMFGMAAGMAFEGKKVWCYAIAPFVTTRVHEFVKLDVCAMSFPITILGVGAGYAYDIMGPSHHTVEDIAIMRVLPNLSIFSPADAVCAASLAKVSYESKGPIYIRFDRAGIPDLYKLGTDFGAGFNEVRQGTDVYILATGIMVHQALKVAERLRDTGVDAGVLDMHRLKPADLTSIFTHLDRRLKPLANGVVTLEEHYVAGGLGSMVAEYLADTDRSERYRLLRIGQGEKFVFDYGGREVIWKKYGLDVDSVVDRIRQWHDRLFGKERGQMRNAVL